MTLLAEIRLLSDVFVAATVAGFAFYGWQQGLFITTIAALQVLASAMTAMAFASTLAPMLESAGVPGEWALAAGYFGIFAGGMLATRLAVGAVVPRDAISFARAIDTFLSAAVGAVAGLVLAGTILVGWSMAALPDWARLDAAGRKLDAGSQLLATFTRCLLPAGRARDALLDGEAAAGQPAGEPTNAPRCSEPFVDANGNGAFDEGERYLDLDDDGRFTRQRFFVDSNGNRRRDFGLRECLRLAAWKDVAVMHTPRITSPASGDVKRKGAGTLLYQAVATDDDPGDVLGFALKADAGDNAADLAIDAATGRVTSLTDPESDMRKTYRFTVVVTDRHGLAAEQPVTVSIAPDRR